ncbi:MAG: tRNA 2-thiouridine(34) synthase MnmA, partial [Planctomycetes bacterium]|nr:tRNA 2-thiouridine(34) synthase MnmA [Planctomycetota bacterium]
MARILCALSGGVDSSVAAWLLQQEGHEVLGVLLRNGVEAEPRDDTGCGDHAKQSCCSASDARDASRVADRLGLAFWALDYAKEFGTIIDRFHDDYRHGRTPSPCVLCNQDLKFGELFALADGLGVDAVATGHYARLEAGTIARARDRHKDQSYFLFGIEASRVPRLRFPLGELTKSDVRELARQAGLQTAEKRESMELCFVPTGDYRDVLRARAPLRPGRFVDKDGRDLGAHDGFEAYTIGQRRGLPALGSKHYV